MCLFREGLMQKKQAILFLASAKSVQPKIVNFPQILHRPVRWFLKFASARLNVTNFILDEHSNKTFTTEAQRRNKEIAEL
jgi:hypothetical protein